MQVFSEGSEDDEAALRCAALSQKRDRIAGLKFAAERALSGDRASSDDNLWRQLVGRRIHAWASESITLPMTRFLHWKIVTLRPTLACLRRLLNEDSRLFNQVPWQSVGGGQYLLDLRAPERFNLQV